MCDGCYNCLREFDTPMVCVGEVQPGITDGRRFGDHDPHLKLLNPIITQCLQKRLACYLWSNASYWNYLCNFSTQCLFSQHETLNKHSWLSEPHRLIGFYYKKTPKQYRTYGQVHMRKNDVYLLSTLSKFPVHRWVAWESMISVWISLLPSRDSYFMVSHNILYGTKMLEAHWYCK